MSVPRLRFKENDGKNFPEWEAFFMHALGEFKNGINKSKEDFGHGVPFVNLMDVFGKPTFENENLGLVNAKENEVSNYNLLSGDVLFIRSSVKPEGVGETSVILEDLKNTVYSGFLIRFREKKQSIYLLYKKYCFSNRSFRNQILSVCTTSANTNINQDSLNNLTVNLPCKEEQTKIANFLTAVDEKITQLTQKCDLLAQYKKGVMQQIFSQELRFKDDDGRDYPAWVEKVMGDVFTFIQTNSFSRELLNYEDGLVKNIHYGDIHTKFKSNFKIDNEKVPFVNPTVDLSKIPESCYCKEGDLVIADASEDYADVGKAIEISSLQNQKLLSGLHTYIARDLSKQMALGFSGYLMQTESVRLQIKILATGVSVLGISKGSLAKVKLKVPSKPEQTKIANFLTAIDNKINNAQVQLAAIKQYKQGLLQQMFV